MRCAHSPYFAPMDSADAATRARARGRFITESLARSLAPGMLNAEGRERIIAGDRDAWALNIDRSGGWREPLPSYRQAAIAEREERLARIAAVYPAAAAEARQAGRK